MSESGKRGYKEAKDRRDRRDDHGGRDYRGRDERRDRDRDRRGDRRRSRSRSRSPPKKKAPAKTCIFPGICWICHGSLFQEIKNAGGKDVPTTYVALPVFSRAEMSNGSFLEKIKRIYANNKAGVPSKTAMARARAKEKDKGKGKGKSKGKEPPPRGQTTPANEPEHGLHVNALYHFLAGQYTRELETATNQLLNPPPLRQALPAGAAAALGVDTYEEYVIKLTEMMNKCYSKIFMTSHTTCNQLKNSVDLWQNPVLLQRAEAESKGAEGGPVELKGAIWGIVSEKLWEAEAEAGGGGEAPGADAHSPSVPLIKRLIEEIVRGGDPGTGYWAYPAVNRDAEDEKIKENRHQGWFTKLNVGQASWDDVPLGPLGAADALNEDIGTFFIWEPNVPPETSADFRNSIFRNNVIRYQIGVIYSKLMGIIIPKIQDFLRDKRRITLFTLRNIRTEAWAWAEEIFILQRTLEMSKKVLEIFTCLEKFQKYVKFFHSNRQYFERWGSATPARHAANFLWTELGKRGNVNLKGMDRLAKAINETSNFDGVYSMLQNALKKEEPSRAMEPGSGMPTFSQSQTQGSAGSQMIADSVVDDAATEMMNAAFAEYPTYLASLSSAAMKQIGVEAKDVEALKKAPMIALEKELARTDAAKGPLFEKWTCDVCGLEQSVIPSLADGGVIRCRGKGDPVFLPVKWAHSGKEVKVGDPVPVQFRRGVETLVVPDGFKPGVPVWFDDCPGVNNRYKAPTSGRTVASAVVTKVPRGSSKACDEARRARGYWVEPDQRKKFFLDASIGELYKRSEEADMAVPLKHIEFEEGHVVYRKQYETDPKSLKGGRKTRRKRRKKRTRRRRKMRRKRTLRGRRRKRQRKKRRTRRKK